VTHRFSAPATDWAREPG